MAGDAFVEGRFSGSRALLRVRLDGIESSPVGGDDDSVAVAAAADHIVALVKENKPVGFDEITALYEGWVITAPSPDLIGHGQRFEEDEAAAVMRYLNYWNVLVGLEVRYREGVDRLLKALPADGGTLETARAVLVEYAVRVQGNARELARNARLLKAQAGHFFANRIQSLTPEEEATANMTD